MFLGTLKKNDLSYKPKKYRDIMKANKGAFFDSEMTKENYM